MFIVVVIIVLNLVPLHCEGTNIVERRVMSNERPSSRSDITLIGHNNLNILCILSLNTILA